MAAREAGGRRQAPRTDDAVWGTGARAASAGTSIATLQGNAALPKSAKCGQGAAASTARRSCYSCLDGVSPPRLGNPPTARRCRPRSPPEHARQGPTPAAAYQGEGARDLSTQHPQGCLRSPRQTASSTHRADTGVLPRPAERWALVHALGREDSGLVEREHGADVLLPPGGSTRGPCLGAAALPQQFGKGAALGKCETRQKWRGSGGAITRNATERGCGAGRVLTQTSAVKHGSR